MTWHFTFAYWSHLISRVWFGFSRRPLWRWEGLKQCISPCYVSLSCPWVSAGQTRKYPRKERGRAVFALLSSARWLMEDQKPQRGEALDSCILFPLNINTPARQMRLQLPPSHCSAPEARIHSTWRHKSVRLRVIIAKCHNCAGWGCGGKWSGMSNEGQCLGKQGLNPPFTWLLYTVWLAVLLSLLPSQLQQYKQRHIRTHQVKVKCCLQLTIT